MLDGVTLVLAGAVGLTTLLWLVIPSSAQRRFSKLPGPKGWPLLGLAHTVPTDSTEYYQWLFELYHTYKQYPLIGLHLANRRFAVLWRAEAAEAILSSNTQITKSDDYKLFHPWLRTGLLTSTSKKWRSRRRLLTPSFHFRILADFIEVFNDQSEKLVDLLSEHVDKASFDVFPYITMCTLDIICETAMGTQLNAQDNRESAYVKAIYEISELLIKRQRTFYLWPDWIYYRTSGGKQFQKSLETVQDFTREVIEKRDEEFQEEIKLYGLGGGQKRKAFLDTLLSIKHEEPDFDMDDVQEEVDTFMFEGHDTTAAGITWALYRIGLHPHVQEKLHQELDAVFRGENRPITDADLRRLKYLECVIKESLRLHPSVPYVIRAATEDLTVAGHGVPKGTDCMILPLFLHLDPRHFPEPEKFDPERFTLENSAGRNPYTYVPFSAGPRNCIGQKFAQLEEKVVLASILRQFHVKSTQSLEEVFPLPELILRPRDGIWIELTRREM